MITIQPRLETMKPEMAVLFISIVFVLQSGNVMLDTTQHPSNTIIRSIAETEFDYLIDIEMGQDQINGFRVGNNLLLQNGSVLFLACCVPNNADNLQFNDRTWNCPSNACMIFGMFDANGELDWAYHFKVIGNEYHLKHTHDGGILLTGIVEGNLRIGPFVDMSFSYEAEENLNNRTFFTIKFNENMEFQWIHHVGVYLGSERNTASISDEGLISYVVRKWDHTSFEGFELTDNKTTASILVTLNENGQPIFVDELSETGGYFEFIRWTSNGLLVTITNAIPERSLNGGPVTTGDFYENIGMVDSNGEWLWMTGMDCWVIDVDEYSDSSLLFLVKGGSACEYSVKLTLQPSPYLPQTQTLAPSTHLVVKLNLENDTPRWGDGQRVLSGVDFLSGLTLLPDDSYVVLGWDPYSNSNGQLNVLCVGECVYVTNDSTYISSGWINGTIKGVLRFTEGYIPSDFSDIYLNNDGSLSIVGKWEVYDAEDGVYGVRMGSKNVPSDNDFDGVIDERDSCFTSYSLLLEWDEIYRIDFDRDGCWDYTEDNDDDNDGVLDVEDFCPNTNPDYIEYLGMIDYDSDGCHDQEDDDIDNDGKKNSDDSCEAGELGWISNETTDYDSDGCIDTIVDQDNDGDDLSSSSNVGLGITVLTILGLVISGTVTFGIFKRFRGAPDDDDDDYVNEEYHSEDVSDEVQENANGFIPSFDLIGEVHESGYEVLEHPSGSEKWWWKNEENRCWVIWE